MMLLSEPLPPPKGIADKLATFKHQIASLESQIATLEDQITTLEDQEFTNLEDQFTTLEMQIGDVEKQIDDKERELESMKQTGNNNVANMTTEELLEYYQKRDRILQKQIELRKEKQNIIQKQTELLKEKETISQQKETILQKQKELSKKQNELLQQKNDLENGFLKGEYYASTSEVWQVEEVIREGNEWQSFVRSLTDKELFNCRDHKENKDKEVNLHPYKPRYHKEKKDQDKKDQEVILDPYNATKNGAGNPHCAVPNSDTTISSSLPQSDTATTDAIVWPKDIFGNQLQTQAITHLVPAGKSVSHKQWLNVAAAVLGIPSTATLNVKKKAARGFIPEEEKHVGGTQSESNSDKVTKRRKMPGTGVIHFVTNKNWSSNEFGWFFATSINVGYNIQ
ncbi:hypothetical protein IV203_021454 [Nitzschia inconspicua]|uniref:Uncharacterized protein n=1 Tax=Nitzschia inconspicua TaxID=303405 RepID=A0A9K3KI40_9STRA|nr:hypothetical protein IV203_021454 [Nitzschia inconspicua]